MRESKAFVPNVHLVNVTTAANYFHLLRRQLVREYRKPLVVFSPKGILRLPVRPSTRNERIGDRIALLPQAAASTLQELGPGTSFQSILVDAVADPSAVERVVLLSGKMYYDLVKERSSRSLESKVAFIRVEVRSQLPPPSHAR